MPEDNLIHLYEGTEISYFDGIKTTAPPIEERMVMIYPKEGAMPRNNCACIIQVEWVSDEQVEAARSTVSNQQKWDTLGAERSGAGWRSGELPEGPVVASSPFGGLSLHILPAL